MLVLCWINQMLHCFFFFLNCLFLCFIIGSASTTLMSNILYTHLYLTNFLSLRFPNFFLKVL
ncbi:hypothetical protein MtrunA17_Chr2g0320041 [Medicago truncatula]|uniref:Transmembrane protein n=1 Tax=Medicago truncatula TaxID=3880 RepID=A0A396JE29_MEDTR|nr:hypothetical protein MtrunA17_Chr2g0320041 [Medicago truncatula]